MAFLSWLWNHRNVGPNLCASLTQHQPPENPFTEPSTSRSPPARTHIHDRRAFPFIPLVIIPSFIFSGIIVPVGSLPIWAQIISRMSPMYYANQVLQELIAGEALFTNLGAFLALLLYGIVVMALAALTLREQS